MNVYNRIKYNLIKEYNADGLIGNQVSDVKKFLSYGIPLEFCNIINAFKIMHCNSQCLYLSHFSVTLPHTLSFICHFLNSPFKSFRLSPACFIPCNK